MLNIARSGNDASALHCTTAATSTRQPLRSAVPLGDIISHIRSNVARRITLDEIANIAQLSVFQLTRAVRKQSGMTPYGLVLEIRIEHAKTMLTRGVSIADVAHEAGFADQSHLTRHFRRRTGLTPKRYCALAASAS
jgi:AraC-like DNA-binding protein